MVFARTRTHQAVLRYFQQLSQEGVSAIVHLKAFTVGQEAVGKTSLVQSLIRGHPELTDATEGGLRARRTSSVSSYDAFSGHKANASLSNYREFDLWDLGGHAVYVRRKC